MRRVGTGPYLITREGRAHRMTVPAITMNNGLTIPQLGVGVFQITPEETTEATRTALQVGYRHIDTAEMYHNEQGVGDAVRASGLDRTDIYITSKLSNAAHEPEQACGL